MGRATTQSAYNSRTEEEAKRFTHPDWAENVVTMANQYIDIFGKENFFVEIQIGIIN